MGNLCGEFLTKNVHILGILKFDLIGKNKSNIKFNNSRATSWGKEGNELVEKYW